MPFSDEDLSDVSEDWDSSGDEAVEKKEKEEAKLKAMEEASRFQSSRSLVNENSRGEKGS